ncbi:MAG: hypothetical protein PVJ26_18885, partial [Anaerolineae bacterium]
AMRFAWLREQSGDPTPAQPSATNRLIVIVYNLIWWVPIVLGFFKVIDYQTAFVAFLIITIFRAIANVIRNNVLTPEQAQTFPLRSP